MIQRLSVPSHSILVASLILPVEKLQIQATTDRLRQLNGILTAGQLAQLEKLLRRRLPWRRWIERVLLVIGATLTLTGVIFFFAYNWDGLSSPWKFRLIEGALAGCSLAAWRFGLDTLAGKVSVLAACVLIGVFLAVFGQIYQTGANTYELFSAWALLIFPWVLLLRFAPLWTLWLVLLNIALVLS